MKKLNIERLLLWFKSTDKELILMNKRYFGLSLLITRLLNEKYSGPKIKFINLYFRTNDFYKRYSDNLTERVHFYNGHLNYDGVWDMPEFNELSSNKKIEYIWEKSYDFLIDSSVALKNQPLKSAAEYMYNKGKEMSYNPNFKLLDVDLEVSNKIIQAVLYVNFTEDWMSTKLILTKDSNTLFDIDIDKSTSGNEFFLDNYKDISVKDNYVVLKMKEGSNGQHKVLSIDKIVAKLAEDNGTE
ncbi:MAG: hypothetical protein AAFX55_01465 [Bacteroidota bacterium]